MTKSKTGASRRSVLVGAAALGVTAPALIGKGMAQGRVTWRVQSHWPTASASFSDSLGVLAEELKKRTDGAFQLQVFGAGEFARGSEIFNIVRRGVVQMGTGSAGYFQDQAQTASFNLGLPGTLRESWEMQHLVKNLGLEDLLNEELAPDGVIYKGEKIYPTEVVLTRSIDTLADFSTLKIRSSGAMLDYLAAAGAAPQFVEGSELYQSLATGVVDGAHWGAALGAKSMSLWEVAKFHMRPALGFTTDAWLFNARAVEELDDDLRNELMQLVEERFFLRSLEYLHQEAVALTEGVETQDVVVRQWPDDVLARFAEVSVGLVEQEAQKGQYAATAAERLLGLMKDLGYA